MSLPSNHGSKVSREVAGRAVDALLGFLRASAKLRKAQLFEHDDFIYLNISVRRFRSASRLKPYRIPLPHTLHPLDPTLTSLCLIADDSQAEAARSTAAKENLPFVSHSVIPLSQLRSDYEPFEARRQLCDSHDMFFAERRIIPILSRIIGNYFFKKKKIPLSINLSRPGWPEAVREACRSTFLHLGSGTCSGLKVGMVSMDREQIIDNLLAAIEGAVEHVPKKWANIRSMFIRSVQSVALPIYQAVPDMGMKIDVSPKVMVDPLDAVVVQETDVKREVDEKNKKKSGLSKKRKVRIHDVDYAGTDFRDLGEENDGDGEEELVNDEFGLDKKVAKKKKKEQVKLIKGKKGRLTGNNRDECEEKDNGGEFIELVTERKKPKRAKKVVTTVMEEYAIKDGHANDYGDCKELQLKKKSKNIVKKSKGKKGKKDIINDNGDQEYFTVDEANVMNFLSSTNADDDNEDHFDEDSHVKIKVNKNRKGGKVKNFKKVKKTNLRQ